MFRSIFDFNAVVEIQRNDRELPILKTVADSRGPVHFNGYYVRRSGHVSRFTFHVSRIILLSTT